MIHPALIPENRLLIGVCVRAWPDGMAKLDRRTGTMTKHVDPEGMVEPKMILKLDDGREFINPEFPWGAI